MTTTLRLLADKPNIPTTTAWYLADLGEARGKQELFTKQSPQRLRILREHALIESAISSNRIEGVTVDQSRVKAVYSVNLFFAIETSKRFVVTAMRSGLFTSKVRSSRFLRRLYFGCID